MNTQQAHGFVEQHGAHLSLILVPTLLMVGLALGAEIRSWHRRHRAAGHAVAPRPGSVRLAAHLSVVAGLIHGLVAPAHVEIAVLYGVFFMGTAFAQVAWAMAVVAKPRVSLIYLGVVANVLIVGLWLVTRTVGIPLGPEAGQVEAVGVLDVIAALLEVGIVLSSVWSMRTQPVRRLLAV